MLCTGLCSYWSNTYTLALALMILSKIYRMLVGVQKTNHAGKYAGKKEKKKQEGKMMPTAACVQCCLTWLPAPSCAWYSAARVTRPGTTLLKYCAVTTFAPPPISLPKTAQLIDERTKNRQRVDRNGYIVVTVTL